MHVLGQDIKEWLQIGECWDRNHLILKEEKNEEFPCTIKMRPSSPILFIEKKGFHHFCKLLCSFLVIKIDVIIVSSW